MDLPCEIWLSIFDFLDKESRKEAALTCKTWLKWIRNEIKFSSRLNIDLEYHKKKDQNLIIWSENSKKWGWNHEEMNSILAGFPKLKKLELSVKSWNKNPKIWLFPKLFDFGSNPDLEEVQISSYRMKFRQLPDWIRASQISYNPNFKLGIIHKSRGQFWSSKLSKNGQKVAKP